MGGMRMGGANAAFANRGAMSRGGMAGGFGGARGGGGLAAADAAAALVAVDVAAAAGAAAVGVAAVARRSDMRLKHDIVLLGRLDDGLGYYRFVYNGGHTDLCRGDGAGGADRDAGSGNARPGRLYARFLRSAWDCRSRPTSSGWRAARICRA